MSEISLIIPVYNMEKYLEQCLQSVVLQTVLSDMEVICVDDGSDDASPEILKKWDKEYNNFRIICKESNEGAFSARNMALDIVDGDYICFMDPDDYYPDQFAIERLYNGIKKSRKMVCGGNYLEDNEGKIKESNQDVFEKEECVPYADLQICYCHPRFMYDARLFNGKEKVRFAPYLRFEDTSVMIKTMTKAKDIYLIKENVYVYRANYKKKYIDEKKTMSIIDGALSCLDMAKMYDYKKMATVHLGGAVLAVSSYNYYYDNLKIWEKIDNFYRLTKDWALTSDDIMWTKEGVQRYLALCEAENDKLESVANNKKAILVYGAGKWGTYIADMFGDTDSIAGFAISEGKEQLLRERFVVKPFSEYVKEDLSYDVIIAVEDERVKKAIANNVKKSNMHIIDIDFKKIAFYAYMQTVKTDIIVI